MKHKHHIIPRHAGGGDEPENLIELTIDEHAKAHRILFEEHGRQEDFVAWKALSGMISSEEAIRLAMLLGSQKAGEQNRVSGHMSRVGKSFSKEERVKIGALGGAKAKLENRGSFCDPELHRKAASKGGKVQGAKNAKTGHLTEIARRYWESVKAGAIAPRTPKQWWTDGVRNVAVDEGTSPPTGMSRGRTMPTGTRQKNIERMNQMLAQRKSGMKLKEIGLAHGFTCKNPASKVLEIIRKHPDYEG